MPRIDFDDLPAHGRIWVFPASRDLTSEEQDRFLGAVDRFLDAWAAHGSPLTSGRRLVEKRFLLVGVDEDAALPSGCSIDALVNGLRSLGTELGVTLVDHAPVWYRAEDGSIRTVSRADFRRLAGEEVVDPTTKVFDTTLTALADFRAGSLEKPAAESWHGRAFFRDRVAG